MEVILVSFEQLNINVFFIDWLLLIFGFQVFMFFFNSFEFCICFCYSFNVTFILLNESQFIVNNFEPICEIFEEPFTVSRIGTLRADPFAVTEWLSIFIDFSLVNTCYWFNLKFDALLLSKIDKTCLVFFNRTSSWDQFFIKFHTWILLIAYFAGTKCIWDELWIDFKFFQGLIGVYGCKRDFIRNFFIVQCTLLSFELKWWTSLFTWENKQDGNFFITNNFLFAGFWLIKIWKLINTLSWGLKLN